MGTAEKVVLHGASLDAWLRGSLPGKSSVLVQSWVSWCIHNNWFDCMLTRSPGMAATDPFYDPAAVLMATPSPAAGAAFTVQRTRLAVYPNGSTLLQPAVAGAALVDIATSWTHSALGSFLHRLARI